MLKYGSRNDIFSICKVKSHIISWNIRKNIVQQQIKIWPKKSSLHSVLLVRTLKPPLWSFLNWLYRGLWEKTALKWEKENNSKWGITWLYIAAAVLFSGLSHYFFSDFFACSYASTDTQKSIFWEQIILCQNWDNRIFLDPTSIFLNFL